MKFDTNTVTPKNEIVPWLAARGELSYSPFEPPHRDYFFLYNFILPKIFKQEVNLKCHYWFGDYGGRQDFYVKKLMHFWENARNGNIDPIFIRNAPENLGNLEAPLAIFKINDFRRQSEPYYLLIQHGSYLFIPVHEQPLVQSGFILLYRGIGSSNKFKIFQMTNNTDLLYRYRTMLYSSFTNSVKSFKVAHASIYRAETDYLCNLNDIFWLAGSIYETVDEHLTELLHMTGQCYTLNKEIAKHKFGPAYATFKTSLTNIRICTYFVGEHEVKILSLDKLVPVESAQCEFVCEGN